MSQKNEIIKKFKIGDLFILLAVLGLCVLIRMPHVKNTSALLTINGEKVFEISLPTDKTAYTYTSNDITFTVELDGMNARFLSSDCPDRSCVNCGILHRSGSLAVCLPAKAVLAIIGNELNDIDAITS